jgi:SOS-response transcriptional repressor LexA
MLGTRLRELRKQQWRDQVEVARETGIDQATLSRLEHGKRSPTHEQLIRLAKCFSVSLDYLTGTSDVAAPSELAARVEVTPTRPHVQLPVFVEHISGRVAYLSPSPEYYHDAFYVQVCDDLEHYFYVRVVSEAMVGLGILPGSLVLVHAQSHVENGQVAVCRRPSGEVLLRKVWLLADRALLIPAHPGYTEDVFARETVTILGRVVQVITDLP